MAKRGSRRSLQLDGKAAFHRELVSKPTSRAAGRRHALGTAAVPIGSIPCWRALPMELNLQRLQKARDSGLANCRRVGRGQTAANPPPFPQSADDEVLCRHCHLCQSGQAASLNAPCSTSVSTVPVVRHGIPGMQQTHRSRLVDQMA
jgi:hypothetical protein